MNDFLDLQNAFDTVNRSILLMALEGIGINVKVVRWFQSYFHDRQHLVNKSDVFSGKAPVISGVQQRPIWGQRLFLIHQFHYVRSFWNPGLIQ